MGGRGLPSILILDTAGKPVVESRYPHSVEKFRATLETAREYIDLRKRAGAGEAEAARAFFLLRLRLDKLDHAAAKRELAKLEGWSGQQKKAIAAQMLRLEIMAICRAAGRHKGRRVAAGRKFLEWLRAGRIASVDVSYGFFYLSMEAAETDRDAAGFKLSLDEYWRRYKDKTWAKKYVERQQKILDGLTGK